MTSDEGQHRLRARWALPVATAFLMAGCALPTEESCPAGSPCDLALDARLADEDRLIQTSAQSYHGVTVGQTWRVEIPYVFVNRTGHQVYLGNCNGAYNFRLEKLVADAWVADYHPILPLCLSTPILIEKGAVFPSTVRIVVGMPGTSLWPRFEGGVPGGTYRIVWTSATYARDRIPVAQQASNRFTLSVD